MEKRVNFESEKPKEASMEQILKRLSELKNTSKKEVPAENELVFEEDLLDFYKTESQIVPEIPLSKFGGHGPYYYEQWSIKRFPDGSILLYEGESEGRGTVKFIDEYTENIMEIVKILKETKETNLKKAQELELNNKGIESALSLLRR